MKNIQTTEQLGIIIMRSRKRLGLTQSQLALASGVGLRFIVDLEAGKPTLHLAKTMQVIDALGGKIIISGLIDDDTQS